MTPRTPGWARRLRRALEVGPPFGPAHLRAVDAAARLRVPIGLVIAVSVAIVPGLETRRRLVVAGIIAGYVILTALIDRLAARVLVGTRLVDLVLAVVATFGCTLLVPEILAGALCVYLAAVVIDTAIAGLRGGLESVPLVLAAALASELLVDAEYRLPPATYVAFAGCVGLSVLIVDVLTRERRRAALALDRVQDALRSLTSEPGLGATLESVTARARDALGAIAAVVMLRDAEGNLVPAAPRDLRELPPVVTLRGPGPLRETIERARPIIVADVETDDRYAAWLGPWRPAFRRWGITALAVVPLRAAGSVLGVLVVGAGRGREPDDDDLPVMQAYADQAALVIVRAQAYERERAAAARLAESEARRSAAAGHRAHELRTPLTSVKGYLDTLLAHWDRLGDDERRAMLERAAAGARTLATRIEEPPEGG